MVLDKNQEFRIEGSGAANPRVSPLRQLASSRPSRTDKQGQGKARRGGSNSGAGAQGVGWCPQLRHTKMQREGKGIPPARTHACSSLGLSRLDFIHSLAQCAALFSAVLLCYAALGYATLTVKRRKKIRLIRSHRAAPCPRPRSRAQPKQVNPSDRQKPTVRFNVVCVVRGGGAWCVVRRAKRGTTRSTHLCFNSPLAVRRSPLDRTSTVSDRCVSQEERVQCSCQLVEPLLGEQRAASSKQHGNPGQIRAASPHRSHRKTVPHKDGSLHHAARHAPARKKRGDGRQRGRGMWKNSKLGCNSGTDTETKAVRCSCVCALLH